MGITIGMGIYFFLLGIVATELFHLSKDLKKWRNKMACQMCHSNDQRSLGIHGVYELLRCRACGMDTLRVYEDIDDITETYNEDDYREDR